MPLRPVLAFAWCGIRQQHFLPCLIFLSFYFLNESIAFTENLYNLTRHLTRTRNSITIHIYNELTLPCSMGLSSAGAHRLTGLWRSKKTMRDCPKNLKLVSYLYMPFFFGHEAPNTNQIIDGVHAPLG